MFTQQWCSDGIVVGNNGTLGLGRRHESHHIGPTSMRGTAMARKQHRVPWLGNNGGYPFGRRRRARLGLAVRVYPVPAGWTRFVVSAIRATVA
jgi:hypothetical protein